MLYIKVTVARKQLLVISNVKQKMMFFVLLSLLFFIGYGSSAQIGAISAQADSCRCQEVKELQKTVKDLEKSLEQIQERLKSATCEDVWLSGKTKSKIYTIYPFYNRSKSLDVYCDFTIDPPGWMTFQRRIDGSEDFYRYWNDYVYGFGKMKKEFWLGLENLHELTSDKDYELRVDMEDFENNTKYAKYSTFKVGPSPQYALQVAGYSGNAGDAMAVHNGMGFSTRDNDQDRSSSSCAQTHQGAWWYENCHHTNPNGIYLIGYNSQMGDGVVWGPWLGTYYSLKRMELKIREKRC